MNAWLAEQGPSFEEAGWPPRRNWLQTKRRIRAAGCTVREYHDRLDERRHQVQGDDELAVFMRILIHAAANPETVKWKPVNPKLPRSRDFSGDPVQRRIDRVMSKPPRLKIPEPLPLPSDLPSLPTPTG